MPGQKMYIVASPDLVPAVQRQHKNIAWGSLKGKFAARISGWSKEAQEALDINADGQEGHWGYTIEAEDANREALAPGPYLDDVQRVSVKDLATFLDELKPSSGRATKLGLETWVRNTITQATTHAIYGPENPHKDPAVAAAWWTFRNQLTPIVLGPLPSLTARKGLAARKVAVEAFERYFNNGGHKKASQFVRSRYELATKHGITLEDMAKDEMNAAMAMLLAPPFAVFWLLLYIYSEPELLRDIRKEVELITSTETAGDGGAARTIDMSGIKTRCPLLISTFQEVLRLQIVSPTVRLVKEDTILSNKWLLKKDAMIQMPFRVLHRDLTTWGSDADSFNPRRFMKGENRKTNPPAYRPFGGGNTMCPGRYFGTTMVLVVVTQFVMRYDMKPVSGEWKIPSCKHTDIFATFEEPDHDVEVEITTRKGFETDRWAVGLKGSGMVLAVAAEDQAA